MFNKKSKQIKQLTNELSELKQQLSIEKSSRIDLNNVNIKLNKEINTLQKSLKKYQADFDLQDINLKLAQAREQLSNTFIQIKDNNIEIDNLKLEIVLLQDRKTIQSYGMYDIAYNSKYTSAQLIEQLKALRDKQSDMLRNKTYYKQINPFYVDDSEKRGDRLVEKLAKCAIRGFNLYSDGLIDKMNFSNLDSTKDKLTKIFNNISNDAFEITQNYLDLKLKEIDLSYNICVAKQKEKEQKELEKEKIKEQELLAKEIEKEREKLNKDLQHYLVQQKEGNDVLDKIEELTQKINDNEYRKERNLAGYVYIISNPSFGKDVYKIGLTRRLPTTDGELKRIDELSNTSVPFKFSPNCIIFSEEVFALESSLHKEFDRYRINKFNKHKEYFKIPLEKIEKVIKEKYAPNAKFDYDSTDEAYLYSEWKIGENFL